MKKLRLYNKKTVFTVIIVLILTISTVSYTLSLLTEANQQVSQSITNFSRGTYDILIRPPQAHTELEKQLNIVENNYLGIGDGGMTMEDWEKVKKHPQVEIAAPVASIGLFTARERTFMLEKDPLDAKYYEVEYATSDGVNTYLNNDSSFVYDFGVSLAPFNVYPSSLEVDESYVGDYVASFTFPVSYHQVVAVDPREEGKLTGYDLTPLLEENLLDTYEYEDGKYSIPIMSLADVSVPVSIKLTIDDLAEPTEEELDTWMDAFIEGNPMLTLIEHPDVYHQVVEKHISGKRLQREKVVELTPDMNHSPFKQALLFMDENDQLKLEDRENDEIALGGAFQMNSQRIGYRLSPVVYQIDDEQKLSVNQIGVDEVYNAPIYRKIEEVEFYQIDDSGRPLNNEDYVGFIENGTFSIKENTETLASTPLGIYGSEQPYMASDSKALLHPSAVPGSFITTPAHGLVSIEHTERIKGEAPIDAIRVKVAGITVYNDEAESLIKQLAEEWRDEGFTVDIVAGASLQELPVEVEGLGKVMQSFTTLGAADTVVSSWNAMQLALTILYVLVVLTFVIYTFFNLLSDRLKDEQLLERLGWSKKTIDRLRYREWSLILGLPIFIVLMGFILFGRWSNEWLPFFISIVISVVYLLLFFLIDRMDKKVLHVVTKQRNSITLQNIRFYRNNILASVVQLFLTTFLTCFLPFFLLQNVSQATKTRLGSFIHGEIEGLFVVIIILLYVLSLVTVYQTLSRVWTLRIPEIKLFSILGWEKKTIRAYFLKEVFVWAGLAILTGWIVSVVVMSLVIEITVLSFAVGILGALLILFITWLGSIYTLKRVQSKGGDKLANRAS